MGFADFYFKKYQVAEQLISSVPEKDVKQIVIIPSFKENNTIEALKSLYFCLPTIGITEVIVLLNYPKNEESIYSDFHTNLFEQLTNWCLEHTTHKLKFYVCLKPLDGKYAGVGLARKTIMDEAIRRFNLINNPDGVIVSFDADCTCEKNYLQSIEKFFLKNPKTPGCSIYFEHPTIGNEYDSKIYSAIVQYELYLRYYIEALRVAGFPYAYHTIGSSFAVKAETYVRQGGMNQRKAGEDFYFLHKIIPLGNYKELNETCVYPSPRKSDRVPFGTGIAISKMVDTNNLLFETYNPSAFETLKELFKNVPEFFHASNESVNNIIKNLNPCLSSFLIKNNIQNSIDEFNANCANLEPFIKRFYSWFNGLMVLQYLNESHEKEFTKKRVYDAARDILSLRNNNLHPNNDLELLGFYRKIQRLDFN
jgi:hypothetical protein